jgi:hypothetical protein
VRGRRQIGHGEKKEEKKGGWSEHRADAPPHSVAGRQE